VAVKLKRGDLSCARPIKNKTLHFEGSHKIRLAPALAMSTSASHAELAEDDVGPATPPNHEAPPASSSTASIPLCPICYEEDAAVILSACQHRSCGACLVRWTEKEESSGRDTGPTCPFCRMAIHEGDILRVVGRPFCPRMEAAVGEATEDDEIDDLTLHWISQNTMPCPFCQNRVEKSDGCDHMECLCGYQFCYRCGGAYGRCRCVSPGHEFDGNIALTPPLRDNEGQVDLGLCIRRRAVRLERSNKVEEEWEHWTYSEENPSVCTFNGRWMFSSKTRSSSIAMMTQQVRHESISYERGSRRHWDNWAHDIQNATWLFLHRGADAKSIHQLLVRDDIREARKEQHEYNYWEEMRNSDWGYWFGPFYELFKSVYDRLLKSLKFGQIIGNAKNQEHLNGISVALERLEKVLVSDVLHKTEHWCHHAARWSEVFEDMCSFERSLCQCRNCRVSTSIVRVLGRSRPCNSSSCVEEVCHETLLDSSYVTLRRMTGVSTKKIRREMARRLSKTSSKSKSRSKMSPQTVARWKRKQALVAWSAD